MHRELGEAGACGQTDRQTDRYAHHDIPLPTGGAVTVQLVRRAVRVSVCDIGLLWLDV